MTHTIKEQQTTTCQVKPKVENPIAHLNVLPLDPSNIKVKTGYQKPYGVQATSRIIPKSVFIKRHDDILDFLRQLGLTKKESWGVIQLLRYWIYYGKVYPKAETVCGGDKVLNMGTMKIETIGAYCSPRTYWYAIKFLEESGLLERIRQFINGYQTSNFYRLDKLVLYVANRMAEHAQLLLNDFQSSLLSCFKKIWPDLCNYEVNLAREGPIRSLLI